MNNYFNGILTGISMSVCFFVLVANTPNTRTTETDDIKKQLESIQNKIDFNYNVINKHLVRIMAYGVKVKEGNIDNVRNPVSCKHISK